MDTYEVDRDFIHLKEVLRGFYKNVHYSNKCATGVKIYLHPHENEVSLVCNISWGKEKKRAHYCLIFKPDQSVMDKERQNKSEH